ncbi:MAG: serine/threonine protein kinase [Planctomycetaceae bacterium]|nr:serine/threonine protein kinase [Planctomycetaceae bacterium]
MPEQMVEELMQRALTLELLTPGQIRDVWASLGTQDADIELLRQTLLRQGMLTNYQMDRLIEGETTGFYFGDYKALFLVGAGSFARVFRAVHKETGKIAAVKVLRGRFSENQDVINQFVREAELGMELRHPNIVQIHEVVSKEFLHFMVMDFVEGQTLRDFLRVRKVVEPKVTTRIITDICSGLDYASKRQLQHRDLKLSNVLLSSSGSAMLVDFGLAALTTANKKRQSAETDELSVANQRAIDYAALERTCGVKRNDNRSDIYFLGCIYYHLLTGKPPLFETKERARRLDKNRFYQVKPIQVTAPQVPHAVSFVVNKAMSLDVEKRYQSMAEMLADLYVAAKRLEEGTANQGIGLEQIKLNVGLAAKPGTKAAAPKTRQPVLMIMEPDAEMQNIFRESFKKAGFRVLIMSDPNRAIDRMAEADELPDCVLINAQNLGKNAVLGFNQIADDNRLGALPMLLLLDESQVKWAAHVKRSKTRIAAAMPIPMKRVREIIAMLIPKPSE